MDVYSLLLAVGGAIALTMLFLGFWRFVFLRDPERPIPEGDVIVSPADGRVIRVEEFFLRDDDVKRIPKHWYSGCTTTLRDISGEGYIVSIFMSLFSVHINRAPIAGMVTAQTHMPGSFRAAQRFPRALLENERNEITIQSHSLRLKVIQVAGLVARRIQSGVTVGQRVGKGQRIGRINLGSQCNLILPKQGVRLCVREGDHVRAGSSIIATHHPL